MAILNRTAAVVVKREEVKGEAPSIMDTAEPPVATGLLAGSVRELIKALASGDYDDQIDALIAEEQGGANRKSAIKVLEARKS